MSSVPYYNPPADVLDGRVGRKLQDPAENPRPFESYFNQLRKGEVMYVGLTSFRLSPVVAFAHTEQCYSDFYQIYLSGLHETFGVYALPREVVEKV